MIMLFPGSRVTRGGLIVWAKAGMTRGLTTPLNKTEKNPLNNNQESGFRRVIMGPNFIIHRRTLQNQHMKGSGMAKSGLTPNQ